MDGDSEPLKDKEEPDVATLLMEMGFPSEQVLHSIKACGQNASIFILSDFIHAHYGCDDEGGQIDSSFVEQEVQFESQHGDLRAAKEDGGGTVKEEDNLKQASNDTRAQLRDMGFCLEHVSAAFDACGSESSVFVISDFIHAHFGSVGVESTSLKTLHVDTEEKSGHMHEYESVARRLKQMGFSDASVQKAVSTMGCFNFEILVDYLITDESYSSYSSEDERITALSESSNVWTSSFKDTHNGEACSLKRFQKNFSVQKGREQCILSSSESEDCGFQAIHRKRISKLESKREKKRASLEAEKKVVIADFTGFGVPGHPVIHTSRKLHPSMEGPPYFYFENVASMPATAWDTIKRHFNGVDPEFVDSKYFSASKRPRGYVHNIPIEGRELLMPLPPMSITEAFPVTKNFWPAWDSRTKLNCIVTRRASDALCSRIRNAVATYEGRDLPLQEQQWILKECKFWNLVWVGPGQVAPLEPHEIELVLGFDHEHTRGSSTITERYEALGNAFQINTVAYHLSPLRKLYPQGISVLSLFSGIGGSEVTLFKNGIYLRAVVSVEIKEKNRNVVESWWKRTNQKGKLIFMEDVQNLSSDALSALIDQVGGFDLIIGGSPCNNLSGNNRVTRLGLQGEESCLFFEFPRILNIVKQLMYTRNNRTCTPGF